jgi:hypothetical protein
LGFICAILDSYFELLRPTEVSSPWLSSPAGQVEFYRRASSADGFNLSQGSRCGQESTSPSVTFTVFTAAHKSKALVLVLFIALVLIDLRISVAALLNFDSVFIRRFCPWSRPVLRHLWAQPALAPQLTGSNRFIFAAAGEASVCRPVLLLTARIKLLFLVLHCVF